MEKSAWFCQLSCYKLLWVPIRQTDFFLIFTRNCFFSHYNDLHKNELTLSNPAGVSVLANLDREALIHTNFPFKECSRWGKKGRDERKEEWSKKRAEKVKWVFLEARTETREGFKEKVLISGTFALGSHGDAEGGMPGRRRWGVWKEAGLRGKDMMSKLEDGVGAIFNRQKAIKKK